MIIKLKEKNNDFYVYKFENDKIKKQKLNRIDTVNALNNDINNISLVEKEKEKYKHMLLEQYNLRNMLMFISLAILLIPIVGYSINLVLSYIILLSSALLFEKLTFNHYNKKAEKKADIYDKKILYLKNKSICDKLLHNRIHNNGYDGSLIGIYSCEDYQITRSIKKYNEINEEKNYIEFNIPKTESLDLHVKRLSYKRK